MADRSSPVDLKSHEFEVQDLVEAGNCELARCQFPPMPIVVKPPLFGGTGETHETEQAIS